MQSNCSFCFKKHSVKLKLLKGSKTYKTPLLYLERVRGHSGESRSGTPPPGWNYPLASALSNLCTALSCLADYSGIQLQSCCSQSSLNSNGSLPGAGSNRGAPEQRVASWSSCFERLLQDPVGVRYFSVSLEKESFRRLSRVLLRGLLKASLCFRFESLM